MNPVYRVREALNYPEDDEIDSTAYNPTVTETNLSLLGSHIPSVRIEETADGDVNQILQALAAADIYPATVDNDPDEPNVNTVIDIPVAHLEERRIILDFPEARDFEPSEVSWENVFHPAEKVMIEPVDNANPTGARPIRGRRVSQTTRYYIEFVDTRGNKHELVRNFGNPQRENGDKRAVAFRKLEDVVDSLRQHGIPERATRYIDN